MTNLSPAAQAVLDAFTEDNSLHDWKVHIHHLDALAAALRVATDQVMPEENNWPHYMLGTVRRKFLAIANELETQP